MWPKDIYLDGTYHVTERQNNTVFYISAKPKQNQVNKTNKKT